MEQLPEVLPTVDPGLGALVHAELASSGVEVLTGTAVRRISRNPAAQAGRLQVEATAADCQPMSSHTTMPSSATRLVEANTNTMAAVKSAPRWNSDLASALAAYEHDEPAMPRSELRVRAAGP